MKEQTAENKPASVAGAGKARLFPKQAGETSDRWSWVERSVWSERMLNRLADSQEQTVWFSLWDKVWNSGNLSQAMLEVYPNRWFETQGFYSLEKAQAKWIQSQAGHH